MSWLETRRVSEGNYRETLASSLTRRVTVQLRVGLPFIYASGYYSIFTISLSVGFPLRLPRLRVGLPFSLGV